MTGLREKKKRDRKNRIQSAAVELFGERGFSTTTMEEIARKSDVGVGTLYNYYNSKGDLLLSIVEDRSDIFIDAFEEIKAAKEVSAVETIQRFVNIYLTSFSFYNRIIWREFLGNALMNQPALVASIWQLDQKFINQFTDLIGILKREGFINKKTDSVTLVRSIYGQIIFNVLQYMADDSISIEDMDRAMKDFVSLIYDGIKLK